MPQRANLDKQPGDVATMFDGVARRYDLMNDLMTLGQVRRWRRAVLAAIDPQPGELVLDLAAGTGTVVRTDRPSGRDPVPDRYVDRHAR